MDDKFYYRRATYYETDRMGIVHHSNHIRYFEEARIDFMHKIGCDVLDLEKEGIIIPNTEASAKYAKPIGFFDNVYVETKLVRFNGSRMEFDYIIRFCDTDEIAATGLTGHCFTTMNMKPVSIRKTYPEFYQRLLEKLEK